MAEVSQRVLPSSVDYTKILPLAVESRSRRRTFLPNNGQSFQSDQNNIIRIDISANAFLAPKHSYLRFRFNNTTGQTCGFDFAGGSGFINRLRISQNGSVLSDVFNYGRLVGGILLPTQMGADGVSERSLTEGQRYANEANAAVISMTPSLNAESTGGIVDTPTNPVAQIGAGQSYIFSVPLINGLIGSTQDKMVPLQLLGSAPIQIEIFMENVENVGQFAAPPNAYVLDEVRYIASLVEVGQEVDNQLRAVQAASRGRLVLNGVDFHHFTGNLPVGTQGEAVMNIPVRKKSMKSLLWVAATPNLAAPARSACYNLSFGGHLNLRDYWMKIGNNVYPPSPIVCNFNNAQNVGQQAEAFSELAKCVGTLNSVNGTGILSRINCYTTDCDNANFPTATGAGAAANLYLFSPFGVDLEAFQKTAIESGVDTSSRALQMSLHMNLGPDAGGGVAADAITIDAYVVYDALYYIDENGRINVSQ